MEKKLFPQFLTLEPWEFGILFRGRESIEGLAWAQDYLADKKKIQAGNAGYACCGLIPYRMKNKQGISVHVGERFTITNRFPYRFTWNMEACAAPFPKGQPVL